MNEANPNRPGSNMPKVPEHLAAGVYATAMFGTHTREEFVLDFLASFAVPCRVVSRIVLHPAHAKRLASAIRDNIANYEKHFGPVADPSIAEAARTVPAAELYAGWAIPENMLAGAYATSTLVRHTAEEFILDFIAAFQPTPIVTARLLVGPRHMRRIANALEARLRMYEETNGKLPEPGATPPPAAPQSPEPPDSVGPRPRF